MREDKSGGSKKRDTFPVAVTLWTFTRASL